MNQVFAGLIFLNTFANTLVHYNLEEKVGLRRLYSTAIDLALDFAWGFLIPAKSYSSTYRCLWRTTDRFQMISTTRTR